MKQKMPVVRQVSWPSVIPQLIVLAALVAGVHMVPPHVDFPGCLLIAAGIILIVNRTTRSIFTRDHIAGIRAYRRGDFAVAVEQFQKSYDYFRMHRGLDRWRALVLGSNGPNSYETMALVNMAFCYSQLGNGARAIELYETVLRDNPNYTLASTALNMLRAGAKNDLSQRAAHQRAVATPANGQMDMPNPSPGALHR